MKDYISYLEENNNIEMHKSVFVSIAKEVINDNKSFEEKDTQIKIDKNDVSLIIDVKVKKGININQECSSLQQNIYDVIKKITDITLKEVNIRIVGFIF